MTSKCKYTGKEGYVQEEDCHCFCCGIHEGKKHYKKQKTSNDKIWDNLFICHKKALEIKIKSKDVELKNLKKIISNQSNLIKKIPETLAIIMRDEDNSGENKLLKYIFQKFCIDIQKHGISYKGLIEHKNRHQTGECFCLK